MLMRSIVQYFGPNGEKLEELTLLNVETGQPPLPEEIPAEVRETEPQVVYLGVAMLPIGVQDSSGAVIDRRYQEARFPIEASSRKEAFEKFAGAVQSFIEDIKKQQAEMQKQSAKNSLIIPTAGEAESINKLKLV
jgi:hypothetical protein